MVSPNEGWAVGDKGTLLHLAGGAWTAISSPTQEVLLGVALTPSDSEGWAVGYSGTLLRRLGDTVNKWSIVNGPNGESAPPTRTPAPLPTSSVPFSPTVTVLP